MIIKDWNERKSDDVDVLYRNRYYSTGLVTNYDIVSVTSDLSYVTVSKKYLIRFNRGYDEPRFIYNPSEKLSSDELHKLADELMILVKLMC
jgi:hypothetical protein